MGGIGSGRPAGKQTVDGLPSVKLSVLRRNGALVDGRESVVQWFRQDQYRGEYRVTATTDQLTINYQLHSSAGQRNTTQIVKLTHTSCYLGSERPWMECPRCNSRVMILYVATTELGCRHCLNLTYASRNEGRVDQLLRSVRNARSKIGAEADLTKPIPPKPKWKHYNKYNLLRQEAEMHEMRFLGSMDEKLQALTGESSTEINN